MMKRRLQCLLPPSALLPCPPLLPPSSSSSSSLLAPFPVGSSFFHSSSSSSSLLAPFLHSSSSFFHSSSSSSLLASSSFSELVGDTALVVLQVASAVTGCAILGKCEFSNTGGSVKDRPAVTIIRHAERDGLLIPSFPSFASSHFTSSSSSPAPSTCRTIVEGTAGNTGIGLALAGNARGYTTVCVLPNTQTQEKKDTLLACGALLVEVEPQKVWHPNHFVAFSGRLAKTLNAFWAQQFDNINNRLSHYESTGPEIW
eukprot:GHVS01008389.1.p1 GENE.GHVS01008389.1~~GHVS01008389.1.p1  ORF type:complete len:257 (-),score=101.50 GHVS01008389.1:337-1107(-)